MKKSLLFSGYYGFDNSGDDAILEAISSRIRKTRPQFHMEVLSFQPSKTEAMYGVKALHRFQLKEVLKGIRRADLFVSGGGSLLQDVTSSRSLWYYLGLMTLAKIMGKKVYVYANGIGPIDRGFNRFLTARVLNRADYITLRDRDSLEFIRSIGVSNEKVEVTADPVFTLLPSEGSRIQEIFLAEGIPDKTYVGMALREWKKTPELSEKIIQGVDSFLEKNAEELLMIPLHYPEDVSFAEKIKEGVKEPSRIHILRENYSVRDLMGCFSRLSGIVAMRLHALIYAVVGEVPILGLSYDPKVKALLSELPETEGLSVEDFSPEDLANHMANLIHPSEEKGWALAREKKRLVLGAERNLEVLDELLEVDRE